ncbi:C-type lectin domain family 4 member D-like [Haliotis rubra]|uniref:C-type lectin domain family 4 member D-like n=1 Tax=Haliotis rubra TaxID=36100 RepID=UPI001EE5A7BE|nr:C-type lectin domain family 4 member D-like [Haliotis rubra]
MEYDNRKIVESEIHTFTVRSMIDCIRACSEETYCTSFQFFSGGPTCVTLRERFRGVTTKTIAAPGYQLFQTDKPLATVGSDCELDVDCISLFHAHCHEGSCRCKVGHRLGGNICRNYTELCVSSPGYTLDVDSDTCYRIETREKRNWTDAERNCTANQGHLVRPDTVTKNNKLRTLLEPTGLSAFWIGVRKNSEWQWLDNTPVTSQAWGSGEPSGDGSCVVLYIRLQYKWNDAPCSSLEYYVCEIPLN